MIKLLDDLSLLEQFSDSEPYFTCLFNAEGAALLPEPELMSIWVETDEGGAPLSAVKVDSEEITLLSGENIPGIEMLFFLTKLCEDGIKRILCGEKALPVLKNLFPAKIEESPLMRCSRPAEIETSAAEICENKNLESVFELIKTAYEMEQNSGRDMWMLKMLRGAAKGQATVLSAEKEGRAASAATIRGRTAKYGAIASVATLPEYREQGLASALVSACLLRLCDEKRTAVLVPANETAFKLYSRLGFAPCGKIYTLHLCEKENQNE